MDDNPEIKDEFGEAMNAYSITEIEIVYKNLIPYNERVQISSSNDAYQYLKDSWDNNRMDLVEEAKLILLSRSNRVLGVTLLSVGGTAGTVVDPKIVFATALKANASSIILAHNHPSGNLTPSDADESLTKQIHKVGKLLTINLADHLILSREGYYSFADDFRIY